MLVDSRIHVSTNAMIGKYNMSMSMYTLYLFDSRLVKVQTIHRIENIYLYVMFVQTSDHTIHTIYICECVGLYKTNIEVKSH